MKIRVETRNIFSTLWIRVESRGEKGLEAGLEMGGEIWVGIKQGKVRRVRKREEIGIGIKVGLGKLG